MLEIRTTEADANAKIIVIGVGGAGNNAVNRMIEENIAGVEFIAVNTDRQALQLCKAPTTIQIGEKLTKGLGAGARPEIGQKAAEESAEEIAAAVKGADMVFVTCGMGGGTGTGATPVIAELAHEMDILTVAIVTTPPSNDGPHRCAQAAVGIEKLRKYVDAIIILSNDAINELYGDLPVEQSFERANDVVAFAAKGIAEIITHKSNLVNVDFADVCTVMRGSGSAIMGVATETGEDRAEKIIDKILTSPLFGNTSISGSRNVLINISVSRSDGLTLNEAHRVRDRVQHHAKYEDEDGNIVYTNIIWGMSIKPNLNEDEMEVVVVATGFNNEDRVIIKYRTEDGEGVQQPQPKIVVEEQGAEMPKERVDEVVVAPTPKFRPAPAPIMRPSRNFAEIEECKRTPAYIKHNITLSTAVKAHQVGGVEKEQPAAEPDMPQLF